MLSASSNESLAFAKVLPLLEVAQLDMLFDYRIPADMIVQPGQLVQIRFHGRKINAIVYDLMTQSDFTGRILQIEKLISEVIMLDAPMRALVERIAIRYVGTRPDVIRLALPRRHATAEKQFFEHNLQLKSDDISQLTPRQYPNLLSHTEMNTPDFKMLDRMLSISHMCQMTEKLSVMDIKPHISLQASRLMWILHPEQAWMEKILLAIKICLNRSHSAIIIVPTAAQGELLTKYLKRILTECHIIYFNSAQGGKKNYSSWLEVKYGLVDIVIGMRSAVYAPLPNLGLIIMFNEGDDLYAEPLAPYPHTRVIAMLRAIMEHCALVIMGYSRSAEVQALCDNNWALSYISPCTSVKSAAITVRAMRNEQAEDPFLATQRIPSEVFSLSQECLSQNKPVLIHVHLKGFSDTIICQRCHTVMRCRICNGMLYQKNQYEISCHWCQTKVDHLRCISCGSTRMRYVKAGAKRTAQELSQAFHSYEVIYSADDKIHRTVQRGAKLIIATSGAEPQVTGGYGAVIFLDVLAGMLLDDLRAEEKIFRSIMNCMSLLEPQGKIFLAADISYPVIREAVKKNPEKFAQIELAKRYEVHFPPAARIATIDGQANSIQEFLTLCELPDRTEILGPIPLPYGIDSLNEATFGSYSTAERVLLRVPLIQAEDLSLALGQARRNFSARNTLPVRIMIDPWKIG